MIHGKEVVNIGGRILVKLDALDVVALKDGGRHVAEHYGRVSVPEECGDSSVKIERELSNSVYVDKIPRSANAFVSVADQVEKRRLVFYTI